MLAFLEYRRENCDQIIRESSDLEIDKIILNLENYMIILHLRKNA